MDVLNHLWTARAVAILRAPTQKQAEFAMQKAIDAGFTTCEFTLNTPGALDLVRAFSSDPSLCVGAGTVLSTADVRAAISAGASFIVSPIVDPALIAETLRLSALPLPGAATPTEMWLAYRSGAPLQKLFPAPEGPTAGPDLVRTLLGPMPFLRIVPTSGVTPANAAAFLHAGAFAVGFVRSLFAPEILATFDGPALLDRAARCLEAVRSLERGPLPEITSAPPTNR